MDKREKVIKMLDKVKTVALINELNEESNAIYKDLLETRNDVVNVQEEMELEIFNIISTMKLLKDKNKRTLLDKYIDNQYEILKKDLFEDDQSNEQIIIKIR